MVRIFNVYYPSRTLVLLCSEIILTVLSFVAAALMLHGRGSYAILWTPTGMAQLLVMAIACLFPCTISICTTREFTSKRDFCRGFCRFSASHRLRWELSTILFRD